MINNSRKSVVLVFYKNLLKIMRFKNHASLLQKNFHTIWSRNNKNLGSGTRTAQIKRSNQKNFEINSSLSWNTFVRNPLGRKDKKRFPFLFFNKEAGCIPGISPDFFLRENYLRPLHRPYVLCKPPMVPSDKCLFVLDRNSFFYDTPC